MRIRAQKVQSGFSWVKTDSFEHNSGSPGYRKRLGTANPSEWPSASQATDSSMDLFNKEIATFATECLTVFVFSTNGRAVMKFRRTYLISCHKMNRFSFTLNTHTHTRTNIFNLLIAGLADCFSIYEFGCCSTETSYDKI